MKNTAGRLSGKRVLVTAAGLLGSSFALLATRDLGFERERVLLVSVSGQRTMIEPANRLATYERIRETVRSLPEVPWRSAPAEDSGPATQWRDAGLD